MTNVLLITENPSIRFRVKKFFASDTFVVEASRETTAMNALRSNPFDFVILDSRLELCNALELAQKIRSSDSLLPILLITGRLKKSFRDEALDAGISDFLQEELDPDELETRIAILKKAKESRKKTKEFSARIAPPQQLTPKKIRKFTPSKKSLPISFRKKNKEP